MTAAEVGVDVGVRGVDPATEWLRQSLCMLGNGYFATREAVPESRAGPLLRNLRGRVLRGMDERHSDGDLAAGSPACVRDAKNPHWA